MHRSNELPSRPVRPGTWRCSEIDANLMRPERWDPQRRIEILATLAKTITFTFTFTFTFTMKAET